MSLPPSVVGKVNVLVTQSTLADARCELATVTLRLVVVFLALEHCILAHVAPIVVALVRALT
jgi:hypothetical protein